MAGGQTARGQSRGPPKLGRRGLDGTGGWPTKYLTTTPPTTKEKPQRSRRPEPTIPKNITCCPSLTDEVGSRHACRYRAIESSAAAQAVPNPRVLKSKAASARRKSASTGHRPIACSLSRVKMFAMCIQWGLGQDNRRARAALQENPTDRFLSKPEVKNLHRALAPCR